MLQETTEPLITNTIRGWVTLIATLVGVVLLPVFSFVVYWMRRGPDAAIAALARDMRGLGEKVERIDKEHLQTQTELRGLERTIAGHQREIIDLITHQGKALSDEIHKVDLAVARLEERGDIGGKVAQAFERYGERIERALLAERAELERVRRDRDDPGRPR